MNEARCWTEEDINALVGRLMKGERRRRASPESSSFDGMKGVVLVPPLVWRPGCDVRIALDTTEVRSEFAFRDPKGVAITAILRNKRTNKELILPLSACLSLEYFSFAMFQFAACKERGEKRDLYKWNLGRAGKLFSAMLAMEVDFKHQVIDFVLSEMRGEDARCLEDAISPLQMDIGVTGTWDDPRDTGNRCCYRAGLENAGVRFQDLRPFLAIKV